MTLPQGFVGSERYQEDIRHKLEDLRESLSVSNIHWSEWEFDFIESMAEKLSYQTINISPKQYDTIRDLWERI